MNYLIGDHVINSPLPFLRINIKEDTCDPPRNVFQILHKHEEVEFLYIHKNKLQVQTPMADIIVREGEAVFIPKNKLHLLNTYSSCLCTGFIFPDNLLLPSCMAQSKPSLDTYTDNVLTDIIHIKQGPILDALKDLIDLTEKPYTDYQLLASLYALWHQYTFNINLDDHSIKAHVKAKGDRLKGYLEYVHLNYQNNIKIEDIASAGFTSVSECNRTFKTSLKTTAYEYLIKYRINKSLDLLKENRTIADIAHGVGYSSPSQFSKYFKKQMGMTPSVYKMNIIKGR